MGFFGLEGQKPSLDKLIAISESNNKYRFINEHWKEYRETLFERKHTRIITGIMLAIIGTAFGVAFWGSLVESLYWWLTLLLPGIGFAIGLGAILITNRGDKSRLNEFNFKKIAFAGIFILSLLLLFWWAIAILIWGQSYFTNYKLRVVVDVLDMFNLGMTCIFVVYIWHHRITGPGEFQLSIVNLLVSTTKKNTNKLGPQIMKNLHGMIKGLDDWCAERLGVRIENIENFEKYWITIIMLDMATFQDTLFNFCTQDLVAKIYGGKRDPAVLSSVIKEMTDTFQIIKGKSHAVEVHEDEFHKDESPKEESNLKFCRESIGAGIARTVGKLGVLSTLFGVLSAVVGFFIIFI